MTSPSIRPSRWRPAAARLPVTVTSAPSTEKLPRRVAEAGEDGPPRLRRLHADLPAFRDQIHLVWRADLHRTRASARVREEILARGRALDAAHGYLPETR